MVIVLLKRFYPDSMYCIGDVKLSVGVCRCQNLDIKNRLFQREEDLRIVGKMCLSRVTNYILS